MEELISLQMLLMDQQRSIESMSEQLIIQSEIIALLEKRMAWLESRLDQDDELSDQDKSAGAEKPPHY